MKTVKNKLIGTGIAMAIAMAAWLPANSSAADMIKGGEQMMMLNKIETRSDAEALKQGDAMAMVCTKCKSVVVHNVITEKGHIKVMTVGEKHLCPGCNSVITVVGVGKGAKDSVTHSCGACGDTSAFCCASKPGAGATKGMEKK